MTNLKPKSEFSRRSLFGPTACLAAAGLSGPMTTADVQRKRALTVREACWIWGHEAGSHNGQYGLTGRSRITPVEAACYMRIPNMIMVNYNGKPEAPVDQYAIPFACLREVVWSIVGAGGTTESRERDTILKMAEQTRNFSGVQMDDFFRDKKQRQIAALSLPELEQLQKRLKGGRKKLDLWVTLYTHQLDDLISEYLKYCDVVTLWTWKAADLENLESNFEKARKLASHSRIVLGCYMWDYGTHKPMPVASMQHQCDLGLKWLEQGRIEGMIFLASCICDLGLEAVEWSRRWIEQVGPRKLFAHRRT